jgi:V/A-type H+-transporting ATPase subunit A
MRLLQKERELQDIVQLVGLDAVQDQERIVIESARLVREGFLRQSALHEVDASCPPAKALWMLRLLLHYARRAAQALRAGASLKAVLGSGLDEPLLRLGEVPAGEIEAAGRALMTRVDLTLKGLEGS